MAKIGGAFHAYSIGCMVGPMFHVLSGDIVPNALNGFGYSILSILNTIFSLVAPVFFGVNSPESNFDRYTPILIGITFMNFVWGFLYIKETSGLKKIEIYHLIRGKLKEYRETRILR